MSYEREFLINNIEKGGGQDYMSVGETKDSTLSRGRGVGVPGVVSITAKTVAVPIVAECMPVKLPSVKIQCKISNFCGNFFPRRLCFTFTN
jgi:hypothetical protein